MRLLPGRYNLPKPVKIKTGQIGRVAHISAPLKGLSLSAALTTGDPMTAPILDNFTVAENRIRMRPGLLLLQTLPEPVPIEALIPYYGTTQTVTLATETTLYLQDNTVLEDGFTSGNWNWTSFSNLSDTEYTICCNGADGVWSWDGTPGGMVQEAITAPTGATHIVPDNFDKVLSHMNRLWFADRANLAVYYLPLQQKDGEVKELPLNAIFRRGGFVRAIYTWTVDGGMGMDDKLVIFSSNAEAAIYSGTDPDNDFALVGVFRFDSPMSMHSIMNYGGDLYAMCSTGLLPMTTLLRAEGEKLGKYDVNVASAFEEVARLYGDRRGWQVILDHDSGWAICNMPLGAPNQYRQLVRKMPGPVWWSWSNLPARCWQWFNNGMVIGSDDGKLYRISEDYLNDNGQPIKVDVQMAWRSFGTAARKQFKMILPYIITDGDPRPYVGMKVDYDSSPLINQPEITFGTTGAEWDEAEWDEADWAGDSKTVLNWQGTTGHGMVGAPRLTALISNCEFALAGWDVVYEQGAVFG